MKTFTILAFCPLVLAACASSIVKAPSPAVKSESMHTIQLDSSLQSAEAKEYLITCGADLSAARQAFKELEAYKGANTIATVIEPLNKLWIIIDRGLNTAGLLRNVHPNAEVRKVADSCEQEFSKIVTEIGLSRPIYEHVVSVDISKEDATTKHYISNVLRDFRRAGVDKDEASRTKIRALKEELVLIGQDFNKNIREDVRNLTVTPAELAGLPQDYIDAHKPNSDGQVVLTTDYPDYLPFMTYAKSDARRLDFYKIFRQRGYPKNVDILTNLLQKRYELAQLLGYDNWATYITEDKMIKSANAAGAFIDKITQAAEPRAKADYNELLYALQKSNPKATSVGDWQKVYLEEQVKLAKYQFDSQAARQYFRYGAVKEGIFAITSKMFDVSYRRVSAPVWDKSVEAYDLVSGDHVIGRFYLDMHPRTGKYNHAAAFPIRSGVKGVQIPEAALVCNFPGDNDPDALMEHDQVETFFHEFGHLLHHLFAGDQRWVGVSGIATEWDFVEAPSQMLEEWAWDSATLKTFAKNTKGETLPDNLIAAMRKARDFGKGLWVRHQMFYAAVSLHFHNRNPSQVDTTALLKKLQSDFSPFDYVDDTYFQYSFGHLEGYSAIYYTYMWSLVIAKDLLSVFARDGMLNPDPAERYRRYVLEPGGSKDAAVLVKDFLGRDYSFDSFSHWINAQL